MLICRHAERCMVRERLVNPGLDDADLDASVKQPVRSTERSDVKMKLIKQVFQTALYSAKRKAISTPV